MDFHALSRKDLQTLCKKNSIRANLTNAAMADALQALELVEGIEDIVLDPMTETAADVSQQSPMGESLRSVNVPRTGGRTSTRRKPMKESGSKEPEETPIPSSVTTRRGRAAKESNVRRRICKEEDEEREDNRSEVPETPATRNGRKRMTGVSARRGAESQDREEKENEKPVDVGLRTCSTRRSTRLSGKIFEEAPPTITKSKGRKEAIKIMALSEESEKEANEGSEKPDDHKEGEIGASAERVGEVLDQDPTTVGADAAPVIPREDSPPDGVDEAVAAVLDLPPPAEGFNQGDQESIEEDLGLPKTASASQEHGENPTESSKIENNAAVIAVDAASDDNQENIEASPAVLSAAEIDGSEPDTVAITAADGEVDNLSSINEGASGGTLAQEVLGHELENIEGGTSCEAAEEILVGKEWEDGDEGGHDTDQGVLPASTVDKVPEDDAIDVPHQQAQDANMESLALRLQQNLTLKCNPDVEEEGVDDGKSNRVIIGYPIPVSEVCDEDAAEQDIDLKASAEESEESDGDAGLQLGVENTSDFSSDQVPPLEDIGLQASAEESEESDGDAGLHLGAENTLDFSSDEVLPLEDTTEGDDLSPSSQVEGGRSNSDEETETNTSFGETETTPTTEESDNCADQSFSANPDHFSDVFNHVVLRRTPVSQRSNVVGGASDPGKASGNKSNKSLRLSLSNKKTPIKSRIFEDADKENKNDGAESARKEGREFGSLRKVKKIALIEDVNKGEDTRQKSLKKKSMGQLKRMLLEKRSPLQALSENCLSRNEDEREDKASEIHLSLKKARIFGGGGVAMEDEKQRSILLESASRFAPPQGVKFAYGTAGFRADAAVFGSTVFRVGILAALRSLKTRSVVGLMITASHNRASDNGVKIADPHGGMMTQEWEPFAGAIANAGDAEDLVQLIAQFVKKENIKFGGDQSAEVLLGRDTRPSGEALLEAAKLGINAVIGAVAVDMGILTTPQLHWMVRSRNKGVKASESDYYAQLSNSFGRLLDLVPKEMASEPLDVKVTVDGSNGVGGEKLDALKRLLKGLVIEVRNSGKEGEGILNEGVGADFVQKEKVVPHGFGPNDVGTRCASLDGDADRLVYFQVLSRNSRSIELIDGDKILSLFALFIKEQLHMLSEGEKDDHPVRLGIVQTAYANGASTDYLKQMGLEVMFTPTGVKYLHEKAAEYDIGIYFEANGHGTILFSEDFLCWLEGRNKALAEKDEGSEKQKAVLRLLAVSQLINQAVGDALSGLLLVEAILQYMGWSSRRWSELYKDLPSRQLKVKVADRAAVIAANAETVVVKPPGLQEAINMEVAKCHHGRSFVRPSGTEDVVRVYAEASTQEEADSLAQSVAKHVDHCLGSGSSL
ncbi:hypothetical protein ACLOJK_033752 [Asimina triloba]